MVTPLGKQGRGGTSSSVARSGRRRRRRAGGHRRRPQRAVRLQAGRRVTSGHRRAARPRGGRPGLRRHRPPRLPAHHPQRLRRAHRRDRRRRPTRPTTSTSRRSAARPGSASATRTSRSPASTATSSTYTLPDARVDRASWPSTSSAPTRRSRPSASRSSSPGFELDDPLCNVGGLGAVRRVRAGARRRRVPRRDRARSSRATASRSAARSSGGAEPSTCPRPPLPDRRRRTAACRWRPRCCRSGLRPPAASTPGPGAAAATRCSPAAPPMPRSGRRCPTVGDADGSRRIWCRRRATAEPGGAAVGSPPGRRRAHGRPGDHRVRPTDRNRPMAGARAADGALL